MLRALVTLIILLGLSACAGNNRFVLLEEEDGSVGSIVIENEAGSQLVDEPRETTRVGSATTAPSEPKVISEQEIAETWGSTIEASPLKPKTFILYFIVGSNRLTPDSQAQLPAILESIKEYPAAEVSVVGHTDRTGSERRNAQLALDRAETIHDLLIAEGLDAGLVDVDSHGESNPLILTEDEVAEPRNRRVEVTVR
ncbi:OmpA family protein [Pelagibius litoralis]|uniref:OmpA family protein n=1 Tax=Pelagibius litoralis TaxID=374515 RepID=A0A967F0W3_9PROT|nr:OmpA family protein [Pelagibius litoralis]NIA70941.1 OmpA family protein [Pelagibius litoralis]